MKTCRKCGQNMAVLFHLEYYCPTCENADDGKDPWDIEFKIVTDCTHKPKDNYVMDDKVFCRACGWHLRNLGDSN